MNILITGALGFVGKHLLRKLSENHTVFPYDLETGKDIRNLHDLDKAFEYSQCTTVIHLAARAGVRRSIDYPDEYITTNIQGAWNVGKMCEKYECRLISFSSSAVYGTANPPTKEEDPKNPISLYGITKLCGENIVNSLTIPTVIIRPFTIYGENGRKDQVFYKWLNQFKAKKAITVYNSKDSCRGYTYVEDIVESIVKLISMKWPWEHEDFNLGGEEIVFIADLVNMFCKLIPKFENRLLYLPPPKEDILSNYASIEKAKTLIDFNPPLQFKKIISRIIKQELNL